MPRDASANTHKATLHALAAAIQQLAMLVFHHTFICDYRLDYQDNKADW